MALRITVDLFSGRPNPVIRLDDQAAEEIRLGVVGGDLCARRLDAQGSKIDPYLERGFARLRKVIHLHDPPHADVDLPEVLVADLVHGVLF